MNKFYLWRSRDYNAIFTDLSRSFERKMDIYKWYGRSALIINLSSVAVIKLPFDFAGASRWWRIHLDTLTNYSTVFRALHFLVNQNVSLLKPSFGELARLPWGKFRQWDIKRTWNHPRIFFIANVFTFKFGIKFFHKNLIAKIPFTYFANFNELFKGSNVSGARKGIVVVTSILHSVRVQVTTDHDGEAGNAYERSCKGRAACKRLQLGG